MLFSSIAFIVYFLPIALMGYFILGFSRTAQNVWLLLASLFFYAWGEPVFVFVLIVSVIANYLFGLWVGRYITSGEERGKLKARRVLIISCILNLGLLFVFKYMGFLANNLEALLGFVEMPFDSIALPIGISFFTFQAISYVVDIYRGEVEADKNPFFVALYISFFPQLVAGPIIRYTDIAVQIRERKFSWKDFSYGICRFIIGLAKKVLIANSMAVIADHCFSMSAMSGTVTTVPVTLAWLGALAYMLQIYFDFSGYSDMAIGLGRMFGFKYKENFNYPYIAKSVVEFWRRWHISLSTWFREYVYIPLGGSRVENNDVMVRNTFIVWVLTGIWHGAEWTFLLWGMWYFVFIIFERVIDFANRRIPNFIRHIYLLLVVIIGWVLFRAEDLYQVTMYLGNMFGFNSNGFFSAEALMFLKEYWIVFLAGIVFSLPVAPKLSELIESGKMGIWGRILSVLYPVVIILLFIVVMAYLTKSAYNPFIYFNF